MAQKRLPMRKVRKMLGFHFDEGRGARAIATHRGLARRSAAQTLDGFAASGQNGPEAAGIDDAALEAALYLARQARVAEEDVDWAKVEKDLSARDATLKLPWGEWRETRPDGTSCVTWCRRCRAQLIRPGALCRTAQHFSDTQIIESLAVIAVGGYLNLGLGGSGASTRRMGSRQAHR